MTAGCVNRPTLVRSVRPRTRRALGYAVITVLGAIAIYHLHEQLPEPHEIVAVLRAADMTWLLAASLATLASLDMFARHQRTLLMAIGVSLSHPRALALSYIRAAMAYSLPGGLDRVRDIRLPPVPRPRRRPAISGDGPRAFQRLAGRSSLHSLRRRAPHDHPARPAAGPRPAAHLDHDGHRCRRRTHRDHGDGRQDRRAIDRRPVLDAGTHRRAGELVNRAVVPGLRGTRPGTESRRRPEMAPTARIVDRTQLPNGATRTTVRMGPIVTQTHSGHGGGEHDHTHTTIAGPWTPPCANCYLTGVKPDLTYADGSSANYDTGVTLHHAVLFDRSKRT